MQRMQKISKTIDEEKYIELPNKTEKFCILYTAILQKNTMLLEKFFAESNYQIPRECDESPITLLAKDNKLSEIEFFEKFLIQKKKLPSQIMTNIKLDKKRGLVEGGHITELENQPGYETDRDYLFAGAAKVGNFSWIDRELKHTNNNMTRYELQMILQNGTAGGYYPHLKKYIPTGNALTVYEAFFEDFEKITSGVYSVYGAAQANDRELLFSLMKKIPLKYINNTVYWAIKHAQDYGHFALVDQLIEYGDSLSPEQKMDMEGLEFNFCVIPTTFSCYESYIAYELMLKNKLLSKQILCWMQPEIQSLFVHMRQNSLPLPLALGFLITSYIGQRPYLIFTEKELMALYAKMQSEITALSYYLKKQVPTIIRQKYEHSGFLFKEKKYKQLLDLSVGAKTAYTLIYGLSDGSIKFIKKNKQYAEFVLKLQLWILSVNPALFRILDIANHDQVIALFAMLSVETLQDNNKLTACCDTFFNKNIRPDVVAIARPKMATLQ